MKTKPSAILLVIICTVFTSLGSVFFKYAANNFSLSTIFSNYNWFIGIAFYLVATLFLVMAFKRGELSTVFPFISLGFIWVSFLSLWIFKESISLFRWIAIFLIIFGIAFIGKGSK